MKVIEIIINSSGQLTINAAGFSGTDCEKATAFLEQALGQLSAKQHKPEFHQRRQRTHQQKVGV
jgi:hypothetical protein